MNLVKGKVKDNAKEIIVPCLKVCEEFFVPSIISSSPHCTNFYYYMKNVNLTFALSRRENTKDKYFPFLLPY